MLENSTIIHIEHVSYQLVQMADHCLDPATLLSSPLSAKISLIVSVLLSGKSALNAARAPGSYQKSIKTVGASIFCGNTYEDPQPYFSPG